MTRPRNQGEGCCCSTLVEDVVTEALSVDAGRRPRCAWTVAPTPLSAPTPTASWTVRVATEADMSGDVFPPDRQPPSKTSVDRAPTLIEPYRRLESHSGRLRRHHPSGSADGSIHVPRFASPTTATTWSSHVSSTVRRAPADGLIAGTGNGSKRHYRTRVRGLRQLVHGEGDCVQPTPNRRLRGCHGAWRAFDRAARVAFLERRLR